MEFMFIPIINSISKWYEIHYKYIDALRDKSWMEWFIEKWGFSLEMYVDDNEIDKLTDLRSAITEALDTIISGTDLSQDQICKINSFLLPTISNRNLLFESGIYKIDSHSVINDWNHVLSEIAFSFARALTENDPKKFRRCENPDCRSFFYDFSKNQKKIWCCNSCSSLIKVRRYRDNHKYSSGC